jgi:hypothetical protein
MNVRPEEANFAAEQSWLAMQYVLGELSESESAALESVMQHDVTLCESVADAARLCAGIALAAESDRRTAGRAVQPVTRTRFSVISACAVLVVTLIVMLLAAPMRSRVNVLGVQDSDPVFAQLDDNELSGESETELIEDLTAADSLAELVAPEWLLTAIELDDARNTSGEFPETNPDEESDVF